MRRPPRPFSFKIKALLVLGLLQFLGLFALGLLAYRESKEELERLAEDKFRLVTERATRELETYVRDESRRITMLAHMPPVQSLLALRDTDDAPGWRRRLEQVFTSVINVHPVVSHELKTPLASLDGFGRIVNQMLLTETFLQTCDAKQRQTLEQVRHRVDIMGHNTARLIRLVDDLLDFSRLDRGRGLEINKAVVDLGPVAMDAVETHAEMAARKNLNLHYEGPLEPEHLWALADADRIAQVFNNLLNNAVKFTDAGFGVRVRAHHVDDFLEFQIRDSGEGIASEELEHIFELFEQASDAVHRKQGTGIGLAISKYIVERHGGYIRAESEGPGRGSCFTFAVPSHVEQVLEDVAVHSAPSSGS